MGKKVNPDLQFNFSQDLDIEKPPEWEPTLEGESGWWPDLNTSQRLIFDDPTIFLLAEGNRGSGKSIGMSNKLVRHCFEEDNAFQLIISPTVYVGSQGVWSDMEHLVLPTWRNGNRYPEWINGKPHPKASQLRDHGIGLEFTPSKMDPATKDKVMWIGNMHGGWSMMMLKSIPHAAMVKERITGPAPSGIYVDEITNCKGPEYLEYPAAQLGRRRGIRGPQQYTASCNPHGQTHWVYQKWHIDPFEDGKVDPNFKYYFVPATENVDRMPPGYYDRLKLAIRNPIERRRMIEGEWIDMPSGQAIFKDYFRPEVHVRGDILKGTGIMPVVGRPIIIGIDPGTRNFSAHFLQMIPVRDKGVVWIVFDEVNLVGQGKPNYYSTPLMLDRLDFWNKRMKHEFKVECIADEAAFNQRNSDGSFEGAEIQRLSKNRLILKPCPKGSGSVASRVRSTMDLLLQTNILISAHCVKTIDMFQQLESKNAVPGKYDEDLGFEPQRSPHIHAFDSMSYPIFYHTVKGFRTIETNAIDPQVYHAGAGFSIA